MKVLLAIAVVLLAVFAGTTEYYRRRLRVEHLSALNVAAQADTTARTLVDSLAVSRRQAEQLKVDLDRRTHESGLRGAALTALRVAMDSLRRTTTGSGSWRGDTLHLDGELDARADQGVRVRAGVTVNLGVAPLGVPVWVWAVDREPLPLSVDFACRRDTAVVHVVGPEWTAVDITKAALRADVCNPAPRWSPLTLKPPSLVWSGGLVVLGWLIGRR